MAGSHEDMQRIYLPDCLASWKWDRHINPHYLEAKEDSDGWLRSFKAFSPTKQHAYDVCDVSLLAGLSYPLASKDQLRATCDMMHVFFVFEEYSDISSPNEVQKLADVVMDALRNPLRARPEGEWIGGEMTRQFWERTVKHASQSTQSRFIDTFDDYTSSVVLEAEHRSRAYVPDVYGYLTTRRDTIGGRVCFVMLELGMDLSDETVKHPVMQELYTLALDMIVLSNDMLSFNKEQACEETHNMVIVAMKQFNTNIAGAVEWMYNYHLGLQAKFTEKYFQIPRWGGPVDRQIAQCIDGVANWVRANDQWHFESGRYFGEQAREVQKTRWVTLLPKSVDEADVGPILVDGFEL